MASSTPAISTRGLTRCFADRVVVDALDLNGPVASKFLAAPLDQFVVEALVIAL